MKITGKVEFFFRTEMFTSVGIRCTVLDVWAAKHWFCATSHFLALTPRERGTSLQQGRKSRARHFKLTRYGHIFHVGNLIDSIRHLFLNHVCFIILIHRRCYKELSLFSHVSLQHFFLVACRTVVRPDVRRRQWILSHPPALSFFPYFPFLVTSFGGKGWRRTAFIDSLLVEVYQDFSRL